MSDGNLTANGHALTPFTVPLSGPVSAWTPPGPDTLGPPRTAVDAAGQSGDTRRYPWPLLLIAAPAAVAIWAGWVGLGGMCGFGPIRPLPGIAGGFVINTAITLPVGVESYGAYALHVWLGGQGSDTTRAFAARSAVGALLLGCLGQVTFHLLAAAHWTVAPWPVVTGVSCLPVVTLSFAAALAHMTRADARRASSGATDDDMMTSPRHDTAAAPDADGQPGKDGINGAGLAGSQRCIVAAVATPAVDKHVDNGQDKTPDKPSPRRTALDRAAAVIRRHPDWTDAAAAKSAGVSAKTVQRARKTIDRSTT